MLAALRLLISCSVASALSARTWVQNGAPPSFSSTPEPNLLLGMMPFQLEEAMLPGETRSVQVTDDGLRRMLVKCKSTNDGCCGQLLLDHKGQVAAVAALLEVDVESLLWRLKDSTKGDANPEGEVVVVANLRCVGRVHVCRIFTDEASVLQAEVTLYVDDEEDLDNQDEEIGSALMGALSGDEQAGNSAGSRAARSAAQAARAVAADAEALGASPSDLAEAARRLQGLLSNIDGEVRACHSNVAKLRGKLDSIRAERKALGMESTPTPRAKDATAAHLPASERVASLDELVDNRLHVLLASRSGDTEAADGAEEAGAGALGEDPFSTAAWLAQGECALGRWRREGSDTSPPSPREPLHDMPLREELGDVWAVCSDAQAGRALLSFAAAATLDVNVRVQALISKSTTERLSVSLCAMREIEQRLAAMVALSSLPAVPPAPPPSTGQKRHAWFDTLFKVVEDPWEGVEGAHDEEEEDHDDEDNMV